MFQIKWLFNDWKFFTWSPLHFTSIIHHYHYITSIITFTCTYICTLPQNSLVLLHNVENSHCTIKIHFPKNRKKDENYECYCLLSGICSRLALLECQSFTIDVKSSILDPSMLTSIASRTWCGNNLCLKRVVSRFIVEKLLSTDAVPKGAHITFIAAHITGLQSAERHFIQRFKSQRRFTILKI